jgi:mitochondrial-processing peptidase subunit alpha
MKIQENYTAPRMVLAASGVHHEELTEIVKSLLEDLPAVKPPKEPKSFYVGGDYRKQAASEVCLIKC